MRRDTVRWAGDGMRADASSSSGPHGTAPRVASDDDGRRERGVDQPGRVQPGVEEAGQVIEIANLAARDRELDAGRLRVAARGEAPVGEHEQRGTRSRHGSEQEVALRHRQLGDRAFFDGFPVDPHGEGVGVDADLRTRVVLR